MRLPSSLPENGHDPCWGVEADSWAGYRQAGTSCWVAAQDSSMCVPSASPSSYQVCFFLVLKAAGLFKCKVQCHIHAFI